MMYAQRTWWDFAWSIWKWWARVCGVLGLALLVTLAIILPQGNGGVWEVKNFQLLTPVVKVGSRVRYIMDVYPKRSCPGYVVVTFSSQPGYGPPATVDYRSTVVHPGVAKEGLVREVDITDAIGAGKWKGVVTISSQCPTDKPVDYAGEFEVTVTHE